MSSAYLGLDMRNAVRVGSTVLPGVLTSLSVSGELQYEQDKIEGSSEHVTSVEGYTTATVSLEITLLGTDSQREAQIRTINATFLKSTPEGQVNSGGYQWRVVSPHLDARRIRKMLFVRFDSRDGNEEDSTVVSLEFKEIAPDAARTEARAAGKGAATNPATGELEYPGIEDQDGPKPNPADPPDKVPSPLQAFVDGFKDAFGTELSAATDGQIAISYALSQKPRLTFKELEAIYPKKTSIPISTELNRLISNGTIRIVEENGQKFYTLGRDFDRKTS